MCKHKVKNSLKDFYVDNLIHLVKVRYPLIPSWQFAYAPVRREGWKSRFVQLCSEKMQQLPRQVNATEANSPFSSLSTRQDASPMLHSNSELWRMSFNKRYLCSDCLHESHFQDMKLYFKSLWGKIKKAKYIFAPCQNMQDWRKAAQ